MSANTVIDRLRYEGYAEDDVIAVMCSFQDADCRDWEMQSWDATDVEVLRDQLDA